jgi:hypothetical protein
MTAVDRETVGRDIPGRGVVGVHGSGGRWYGSDRWQRIIETFVWRWIVGPVVYLAACGAFMATVLQESFLLGVGIGRFRLRRPGLDRSPVSEVRRDGPALRRLGR